MCFEQEKKRGLCDDCQDQSSNTEMDLSRNICHNSYRRQIQVSIECAQLCWNAIRKSCDHVFFTQNKQWEIVLYGFGLTIAIVSDFICIVGKPCCRVSKIHASYARLCQTNWSGS